ncbi:MAG: GNAT family N-acetyltransferase [Tannerellaceae bacterium]|nr:GNAT family N-acetyltransferase [Tannerellaceae bacterium]
MMMNFSILIWLLPLVFMLHDFEEIIFFKSWIEKNRNYLSEKYPKLAKRFLSRFEDLSVPGFTIAVAEEFILLSIITVCSVISGYYLVWLGVFMGFFIHLFIHIVQWIIIKRYIPAIYTTFISLIYCIFTFIYLVERSIFTMPEILWGSVAGFILIALNLILAHKLTGWFDKKNKIMKSNIIIREIKPEEIYKLEDLMYEAVFQRDPHNLIPRSVLKFPEVNMYIKDFGTQKDDYCLVAETDRQVIGGVWVRILNYKVDGLESILPDTPESVISLFKKYRNKGIGTRLMQKMIAYLREKNYKQAFLKVEKENYAVKMYQNLGFIFIGENQDDYLMMLNLEKKKHERS